MAFGIEQRASLAWIGLLRIANGALLLLAGIKKLRPMFRGPELAAQLGQWAKAGLTFEPAKEWLKLYVQPHLGELALAVTAGELVAGASLFLGFASRLGAFIALLLNVAYFLASRESINVLMAIIDLAVLVSGGGRAFGVDAAMKKKNPRWILG